MSSNSSGGLAPILELYVGNIPYSAHARELVMFLESLCGQTSVASCKIMTKHNGTSKGYGFVMFESEAAAELVLSLAQTSRLVFQGRFLKADASTRVQHRPSHSNVTVEDGSLYIGNLVTSQPFELTVEYLWETEEVKAEIIYSYPLKLHLVVTIGRTKYKLELHFDSIASVESCTIHGRKGILFQLYYAPRIYMYEPPDTEDIDYFSFDKPASMNILTTFSYFKVAEDGYDWVRAADFTEEKAFGQSLVFCLQFPRSGGSVIKNIMRQFKDYNLGDYPPFFKQAIRLISGHSYASEQELVPILRSTCGFRLCLELEFKVNYLVQVGYISPPCLTPEFFNLLATNPLECCLSALETFEKKEATCLDPVSKLRTYLKNIRRGYVGRYGAVTLDEGQVYIKKVIVTPTKVYFMGPEIEVSNRVTREFCNKIDRFLRVTFADEDYDFIPSIALLAAGSPTKIHERVITVLQNGVRFGGMDFQFLAFSASQLREDSLWMFAADAHTTPDEIRHWMGDFVSIRNVAKYAARMGQSFSTSTHTLDVPSDQVLHLPDIQTIYNGKTYCFSDGIGKISRAFAIEVARKCRANTVPSAFQIRYGGYKGVVAVDPTSEHKLSLRPSMNKFPSRQTGLDVISWTKYIPCYLNREVITLLSTLGVTDEVFEHMQEQVVQKLDLMLHDASTALEVLQVLYAGECHKFMVRMLQAGYSPRTEPYLRSLLQAFRASQLFLLRTKSRIPVFKGRCLMGCLDEARILHYGQCFVQVSPAPGSEDNPSEGPWFVNRGVTGRDKGFVVRGYVVVAKNPCLHPGDVLVLEAVDVPELHHMIDCVVFPQRGRRPHPNECSGSDLDGDLYFVSWDNELIPPSTHPPMDYEPAPAVELDHPVTLQEIQTFFVNHMSSDNLGSIAHAYLALADASVLQAKDPNCMELARLFSIAVDFPKTGVPAVVPLTLRPRSYPDFMEKHGKPSYESKRVIGKMYRSVKDHNFNILPATRPLDEYDEELLAEGFEHHVEEAAFLKERYDGKLMGLLNHFDITEAELMSGCIKNLSKYYRKRAGEQKERILLAARALVKEAKGWFEEDRDTTLENYARASAWYHVTYNPEVRTSIRPAEQLVSFPWVVYEELLKVKALNRRNRGYRT